MIAVVLVCAATLCSLGAAQAVAVVDCNQVRDLGCGGEPVRKLLFGSDHATNGKAVAYRNRANAGGDR